MLTDGTHWLLTRCGNLGEADMEGAEAPGPVSRRARSAVMATPIAAGFPEPCGGPSPLSSAFSVLRAVRLAGQTRLGWGKFGFVAP